MKEKKYLIKYNLNIAKDNKRQRIPNGQSTMDNPEKLVTLGTQDEEKQIKNTTQYVLDTTMPKQTQIRK